MNDAKVLRFAELVIKPCSRTYGSAPCTASIPATGDFKCYNSPRTCQDPANYLAGAEQVIRWAEPTADLPVEIEAMPCITSISRRPQKIDPGESFGVRESVTVSMHNFKHNDDGFDNYLADRTGNTYNKGTYWGKFSARWGSLEGYEFRTVDGYVGQDINSMSRRYYVVDSTSGPDSNGIFSFTAKDAIKFLDGDKGQWPLPSNGVLLAAITDVATTLTLDPVGVGAEYASSGVASIGDEKVTFTRAGDVITLTARGLSGTTASDHDIGETFQQAAVFSGIDPAEIFRDLLTDGTDIPATYIDYAAWKTEVDDHLGRLYTAEIMRPTPVKQLLEELIRESGLTVYADLEQKKIALKVLRQETPVLSVTDDIIIAGSISSKQIQSKRVSDVWVYYGKKNPLEPQSDKKNYSVIYAKLSSNPVTALEENPRAIREIPSRWITVFNSPAAESVSDRIIARFETAPRQISFKVLEKYQVTLSDQVSVQSRIFEDSQGDPAPAITCQAVQIDREAGVRTVLCEEVVFGVIQPPNPDLRIIEINADAFNLNMRTLHDSIYTGVSSGQTVRLVVASGVIIGSTSTSAAALDVGSWPAGVVLEIDGGGRIEGMGGDGGTYTPAPAHKDGYPGGTALKAAYAISLIGGTEVWGGGGGGAVAFFGFVEYLGGGGAGKNPGTGYAVGDTFFPYPTPDSGGWNGGDPGQAGGNGSSPDVGGAAGNAIDGVSFVTITGAPDIRGPQVN